MYRAVTWAAIQRGVAQDDEDGLTELALSIEMRLVTCESGDRLLLDEEDITDHLRDQEVERRVSLVSAVLGVRGALVEQQRALAEQGPIVMVGRDIGTVVFLAPERWVGFESYDDLEAASVYEFSSRKEKFKLRIGVKYLGFEMRGEQATLDGQIIARPQSSCWPSPPLEVLRRILTMRGI